MLECHANAANALQTEKFQCICMFQVSADLLATFGPRWVAVRPHGGAAFQAAQHAERTKDISREKAGHVGECHTGRLVS